MLDQYKELQKILLAKIEELQTYYSEKGNGRRTEEGLKELCSKLLENRFHLVALGQFKRGKSTFINSVLGDSLPPTSVIPLISIVTVLKYEEKEAIEKALGMDGIRIYPLSARMALEGKQTGDPDLVKRSGLPLFDKVLGDFLLKAKGKTILRNALNSARKLLADKEMAIELESRAIATPLDELEEKIKVFQAKMEAVKQDREDTHYYFEGEINRLIDLLDRDLERLKEREIPRLLSQLEETGKSYED